MKKYIPSFLFFLAIALAWTSCQSDEPSVSTGDLVSAKYDPATKSFIVKYSSGKEMSYPATVDNSVDPPTASYSLDDKTYLYVADATIAGDATISEKINTVSQFVYDGLSTYYLWADYMTNKKPTIRDVDPEKYFERVLYTTDTQNSWSWITDDVSELLADFSGEPLAFGFSLAFATTAIEGEYYAVVKYVFPDSPAANEGLIRKDLIGKINGQPITDNNWQLLYGSTPVNLTIYKLTSTGILQDRMVNLAPVPIKTDPVLIDSVYQIGGKKIGYLFYTDYITNYNNRLYEVFSKFKQDDVTDLILDLRYNGGGAVSSAIYLASLIAPRAAVENKSPFVIMDYNNLLNTSFDQWYKEAPPADKYMYDRKDYLGTYDPKDSNPLDANLDLKTVYIIATDDSYSASELTLFCLKPYMNVVHIGYDTGGKYTASWTIHGYDEEFGVPVYDETKLSSSEKNQLKNWAMQPIVAIYANKDSENFSNPGYLIPDHKLEEGFGYINYWTPLGDTKDVLLGQALYLISGDESYLPVQPQAMRSTLPIRKEMLNSHEKGKPVIMDNIKLTAEDFQKLQQLRN